MPTYDTPVPIDLAIDLQVGAIQIIATDRADTLVTVSPTNPAKAADCRGAEDTKVVFDGARITITGPRPRFIWLGPSESIDVKVELPTGSRLTAEVSVGGVRTVGRLGNTRIKSSMGPVDLDSTGDLWLRSSLGNTFVASADGAIEITADKGQIRVGTVTGDALLKSSHGSIQIDESGGDVDARLSFGDLEIRRALGSVATKTSYGSIQLREVSGGNIELDSGFGQVSVGVRQGIPVWLDLASKHGRVRNELDGDSAPDASEQAVAVRARTQGGDITIHRAR